METQERLTGEKEGQELLTREQEQILNTGRGGKFVKVFIGKEIEEATNKFSSDRILGLGGFGDVYKGILTDGTVIVVKCTRAGNCTSNDQMLNEVWVLCQIARDVAEALTYRHSLLDQPIYHRDVKSSKILLDKRLNAKVADFELCRLAHVDKSHVSTGSQGTLEYLDPEYYKRFQLFDKSDVYSFGIVLLELLTSQKVIDTRRGEGDKNLGVYMKKMMKENKVMDAIDPVLKDNASELEVESMKVLAILAMSCLEEHKQDRPTMKYVAEEIISITLGKTGKKHM